MSSNHSHLRPSLYIQLLRKFPTFNHLMFLVSSRDERDHVLTDLIQNSNILDLNKEFEVPPYSQSVQLGSQVEMRCHPPKGKPQPRVRVTFYLFQIFANEMTLTTQSSVSDLLDEK